MSDNHQANIKVLTRLLHHKTFQEQSALEAAMRALSVQESEKHYGYQNKETAMAILMVEQFPWAISKCNELLAQAKAVPNDSEVLNDEVFFRLTFEKKLQEGWPEKSCPCRW
jgi:hypothetical protein